MIKLAYMLNEGIIDKPLNKKTTKEIPVTTAIKAIQKHCSEALSLFKDTTDPKVGLFRGYKVHMAYGAVDPKSRERTGLQNLYNALTSILPAWKEFPPRSYSVMFSNRYDNARQYGDIYWLFPFDGARIGHAHNRDAWYGFEYTGERLGAKSSSIDMLLARFSNFVAKAAVSKQSIHPDALHATKAGKHFTQREYTVANTELFLKQLGKLSKPIIRYAQNYLESYSDRSSLYAHQTADYYIAKDILKNYNGNWIEYFNGLLDPEKNNMEVISIADIKNPNQSNEFWTDEKCIMVNATQDSKNYFSLRDTSVCGILFKERMDKAMKSGTLHNLGIGDD